MGLIRILFLSDSHLGFDLPVRPRLNRPRRGEDFFASYQRALHAAETGVVDAIVHGGDLFFRSRVPAGLVQRAYRPLIELAERGLPVYIVPGNHERSRLPFRLLAQHPRIHIFDRPRTFRLVKNGLAVALSGFPFIRQAIRFHFKEVLEKTGWHSSDYESDFRLLCLHQCIEGATVGPQNYMFREGGDVIRTEDIPGSFSAVLAGHIHRFQVLKKSRKGRTLPVPVFYPGSTERTSRAEFFESKGYLIITIAGDAGSKNICPSWEFKELATGLAKSQQRGARNQAFEIPGQA